jgi:uncharacterized protein (DUF1501 family)
MRPYDQNRIDRRRFVRLGLGGLAGLLAGRWMQPGVAPAQPIVAGAKACIVLWMNGGPSHIDTFDPKPSSQSAGPFKAIPTSAPGIQICEHLPLVAAQAHHLAICRSMTSREGSHQRAQQLAHTGYIPNPTVDHPSLGAWVSAELGGGASDLPHFVSLGGPSTGPGFLGLSHGPFVVPEPGRPPLNIAYGPGVDATRFDRRRAALEWLEDSFAKDTGGALVSERKVVYGKAVRMMQSPKLSAFDISTEPAAVKASYGDTPFGRGCLTARRLVEAGVRFVEVVLDGWDTHRDNFSRTKALMGALDPAMSSLVRELAERGLLDKTLVVWMGEFGRTPRIGGDEGRDHHPAAWTAVLAGGGIRGGIAHGQTDAEGGKVVDKPVSLADLFATLSVRMGMDPQKMLPTPGGRPIAITDGGVPVRGLMA